MKFLKRFYNPFKPHIIQFSNGEYLVRRRAVFAVVNWSYLDKSTEGFHQGYWWTDDKYVLTHCTFDKLDSAKVHLENYLKPKIAFARRVE